MELKNIETYAMQRIDLEGATLLAYVDIIYIYIILYMAYAKDLEKAHGNNLFCAQVAGRRCC